MLINGQTKVVGIIGDPVKHSLSPQMHNAAFNYLKLDFVYIPFHVKPESLGEAIRGMRALDMVGLNVTVPHKIEVMKYLDEVSSDAKAIGAVNTVFCKDNKCIGDNTDGRGFIRALIEDEGITVAGKSVVILGAGGSARAIGHSLIKKGVDRLIFCNRTVSRAEEMAKSFQHMDVFVAGRGIIDSRDEITRADMIINTTSAGMKQGDSLLIDPEWIRKGQIFYDIIYSPPETLLLQAAKARGARTINGLGMLIHQGALAFEIWTGCSAPVEVMREAILNG
ncbi:shikimate dehydrogenase [Candidatus Desantisbacteria bacterium]|nr:shikimate dehydrogenase [Candidatus Desantisbacteria bacterium]